MKKSKILLALILPFLAILTNVSALSVSDTLVGYGYTQEYNGVVSSRTWVTYNSNNLVKYNYELPNSSEIDIDTFNFRFHITGNFLRGNNYILTFSWANYSEDGGFSLYYSRMIHSMLCYSSSWSSSSQTANNCFSNYNISYSTTSNIDIINVTLSFTPINDIYGIAFINEHDNDPYSSFPSEGWEITDINYQLVSSGTSEIIDNATENTENIINNQNQNTQLMIDEIRKGQITCGYNYSESFDFDKAPTKQSYVNSSNQLIASNYFNVSDYTLIFGGNSYDISWGNYGSASNEYLISVYDSNKSFVTSVNYRQNSVLNLSTYSGLMYIRVNLNSNVNNRVVIVSKDNICVPTSYLQMKQNDDINNNLSDINDSITDNTPPDTNELSNATGWLPPGPVDSILNLPLTLLQSLNNAFSSNSCQPINVNLPYVNTPLTIPCMSSVWEGFGLLPLFTWIGRVLGGVLLYKYLIGLYKWVDDTLTMRENNNFDDGSLG